jgi:hypothetical protein
MNPAVIPGQIIDTMRNDDPLGEAGKIMIKGLECLLAGDFAITVERPQQFFLLGINAQHRVPSREKLLDEISVAERSLPLWNLVEMLCQPRAQVLLHRGRQL